MSQFTQTDLTQELQYIQARIAAVARGIQSNPSNAIDYAQALEVQLILLNQVIHHLNLAKIQGEPRELHHHSPK